MNDNIVSFIPLGGIGDVTRNMYLYEYKDQILIVDCGLGFADETMLGVDLLLPDISYLVEAIAKTNKKIVGMVISHGHEDHMGAVPLTLPQLPQFPIFTSPLTAALLNEKLKEFGSKDRVNSVPFDNPTRVMGDFSVTFIRVTHSVPDTSHLFIKTPIGNFYHGSDFKFDETPWDKKITDYKKIEEVAKEGILCLFSDCLGSERKGITPTEAPLYDSFVEILANAPGRVFFTTFSSHVARLDQVITAASKTGKKVCFVGRSLLRVKDTAIKLGYLTFPKELEVSLEEVKRIPEKNVVFLVAGSQGQESSAMTRIINGEHQEIRLSQTDTIVFSSDTIPGNEVVVNSLFDSLGKKGIHVLYPKIHDKLHVSGHGSLDELLRLIQLTHPQYLLPIGGNFRHMALYKNFAKQHGFNEKNIFLVEDGQGVNFSSQKAILGKKIPVKKVFVDEITGEEVEHYVLRDRQKLSESGIVIVMTEIDATSGQLVAPVDTIIRAFPTEAKKLSLAIEKELKQTLRKNNTLVTNWVSMRKLVGDISQRVIFRLLRRRPLVLPIVIEV